MQPYSKINMQRMAKWGIPTIVTLAFIAFLLARPIISFVIYSSHALGFAFCNPTLWLLGQDHLMWETPLWDINPDRITPGAAIACILSGIIHLILLIFIIWRIVVLWIRANRRTRRAQL